MFSEKIKSATKTNHQELEKLLIPKMKAVGSEADYVALLKIFYAYFGGLETKFERFPNNDLIGDYAKRRKVENIADDIRCFKEDIPQAIPGNELPEIKDQWQALGALYVVEGSTLGGPFITKMIAQALQLDADKGFSFFNGYGEDTQVMWDIFREHLNDPAKTAGHEDEIIEAANQTFLKFREYAQKAIAF